MISLRSQGMDRVQMGRFAGRQKTEQQAGGKGTTESEHHRQNGHVNRRAKGSNQLGGNNSQYDTNQTANGGHQPGFRQKLLKDIPGPGTGCHADADFPGTLGDAHQHDVHDADTTDQKGNGRDGTQQPGQRILGFRDGVDQRRHVPDGEILNASMASQQGVMNDGFNFTHSVNISDCDSDVPQMRLTKNPKT